MGKWRDRLASGAGQRFALIFGLAVLVTCLVVADAADRQRLLEAGVRIAEHPLALPGLVLLQAAMFALGLPGAVVLWLVAPFYPLATSIVALLVGSLLGALLARAVGAWLGEVLRARHGHRRAFQLLARRGDLATQTALRLLPGFPHSVVNYGAGVLGLPLGVFLLAAAAGYAVKWPVYVLAVQSLAAGAQPEASLGLGSFWPLVLLAVFLVAGNAAGQRWRKRSASRAEPRPGAEG